MAIIWCGGEEIDFPTRSANLVAQGSAGYRRAAWSRVSLECGMTGQFSRSNPFGSDYTSIWLRFYFSHYNAANVRPFVGLCKSSTQYASGLYFGFASGQNKMAIIKWDGSTPSVLASEPGTSFSTALYDMQIASYGASGTVRLYQNGVLLFTYTGDITVSGVAGFDQVCVAGVGSGGSDYMISEIVAATEDTRSIIGLQTIYPNAAGDKSEWTGSWANVNESTLDRLDTLSTGTADKDHHMALSDLSSGIFSVRAVRTVAEAARGSSGPTKLALGNVVSVVPVAGADYVAAGFSNQYEANNKLLRKVIVSESVTVTGVRTTPDTSSTTAKMTAVIYADSSGSPGARIAVGTEVVGMLTGTPVILPISASVTSGTAYWVGYISDTTHYSRWAVLGSALWSNADTYSDGPSDPAGSGSLGSQPASMALVKSTGASASFAADVTLATTFGAVERVMETNPGTSAEWTADEVNNLQAIIRSKA